MQFNETIFFGLFTCKYSLRLAFHLAPLCLLIWHNAEYVLHFCDTALHYIYTTFLEVRSMCALHVFMFHTFLTLLLHYIYTVGKQRAVGLHCRGGRVGYGVHPPRVLRGEALELYCTSTTRARAARGKIEGA